MKIIKEITALETFPVRHPVLRKGKPLESCHFDGDNLETTRHFGLFTADDLIGIISVFENGSNFFQEKNQFQIRGMAILEGHQKKGHGEDLIRHAEKYIRARKGNLIWFNARIVAAGFYEKLGYAISGNPFEIADVGTHYVMFKKLND